MKSFDNQMIQIKNELLNLKTYLAKKTSVFKTGEYGITIPIQLDTNVSGVIADGTGTRVYTTENGATALASLSIPKDFLDGIYNVDATFLPNNQKDSYILDIYISTDNQEIINRIIGGETIIVNVPVYITTTGTFGGMQ